MNDTSGGLSLPWPLATAIGVGLLALGAGGAAVYLASHAGGAPASAPQPPAVGATMDHASHESRSDTAAEDDHAMLEGVTVTLTPELVRRAQIADATVETVPLRVALRLPGETRANAYRAVSVTPLVAGRVTTVSSELGEYVAQGATMARIYSPELAQAQTRYLASRSELGAHTQRLRRTERLVEIGAASQQELEQVEAEHTAMTTRVEADRSTLELLGLSAERVDQLSATSEVSAVVEVPAPIAGVVTERSANVGLNVEPSMSLFTVVDLSTVWVVADLYERDFGSVHVGSEATVTTTAYPGFRFDGRVSYIDPQVRQESRTAMVRVEVPNRDGRLRLGMYVDVDLDGGSGDPVVAVPIGALQSLGDRYVVYLPGAVASSFVEREVRPGARTGDLVAIESGLSAGERVVTEGAFFIRAERERVMPEAH